MRDVEKDSLEGFRGGSVMELWKVLEVLKMLDKAVAKPWAVGIGKVQARP